MSPFHKLFKNMIKWRNTLTLRNIDQFWISSRVWNKKWYTNIKCHYCFYQVNVVCISTMILPPKCFTIREILKFWVQDTAPLSIIVCFGSRSGKCDGVEARNLVFNKRSSFLRIELRIGDKRFLLVTRVSVIRRAIWRHVLAMAALTNKRATGEPQRLFMAAPSKKSNNRIARGFSCQTHRIFYTCYGAINCYRPSPPLRKNFKIKSSRGASPVSSLRAPLRSTPLRICNSINPRRINQFKYVTSFSL